MAQRGNGWTPARSLPPHCSSMHTCQIFSRREYARNLPPQFHLPLSLRHATVSCTSTFTFVNNPPLLGTHGGNGVQARRGRVCSPLALRLAPQTQPLSRIDHGMCSRSPSEQLCIIVDFLPALQTLALRRAPCALVWVPG